MAENRFEHGNYLSSNNQFLDRNDDAGFIFVSSELKVKYQIASNCCECISSPVNKTMTKNKQPTHVWASFLKTYKVPKSFLTRKAVAKSQTL